MSRVQIPPSAPLLKGTYIEVKGYIDKKNEAKIRQFPHKLKVFIGEEVKPFLNYTIEKYGKDFIKLYENSK